LELLLNPPPVLQSKQSILAQSHSGGSNTNLNLASKDVRKSVLSGNSLISAKKSENEIEMNHESNKSKNILKIFLKTFQIK